MTPAGFSPTVIRLSTHVQPEATPAKNALQKALFSGDVKCKDLMFVGNFLDEENEEKKQTSLANEM